MPDHGDIQNLWSPTQDLSNDTSYVGLFENFIISTCLRVEVWDGIFSLEGVGSWWYSKSVISDSRPFEWYILYVGSFENFIISTCLRVEVWDGIISLEGVGSWWFSKSVIS